MTTERNPQDTTLRNVRAANKRLAALEAGQKRTNEVLVRMAIWILRANPEVFEQPLTAENVAQVFDKLK